MTVEMLIYLGLGAVAGGFINGLAGTGTALFALGFYLVVLDPLRAVAVIAVMSVLVGLQGLWIVRAQIKEYPKRLLRFLLPGLAGVPVGLMLLSGLDAQTLRIGLASLLIVYGCYFGCRVSLPTFTRPTPIIDSCVGFIGGILSGAASLAGVLPTMWLSLRPWPKSQVRAVMQPYNVVILTTTIALLAASGAYDALAAQALLVTIPLGVIAAQLGIMVYQTISDHMFRRLLIMLTWLMGIGVMLSELT